MAHKKGAGSSDNGRDSMSKRLGVKLFGGQLAKAGNILVRQRGTKFHAGENVYMGRDHTLHAGIDGHVVFKKTKNDRRFVSILPISDVPVTPPAPTGGKGGKILKPAVNAPKDKAQPAPKPTAVPTIEKKAAAAPVVEKIEPTFIAPPVVEETVALVAETTVESVAPPVVEETVALTTEMPAIEDNDWAEVKVETTEKSVVSGQKIRTPLGNITVDDLKIVEGIGPKIEQLMKDGGIHTWKDLSEAPVERLQEILNEAGPRYQIHNPNTWPSQAKLLVEGRWEELKEYQDLLIGGRDVKE